MNGLMRSYLPYLTLLSDLDTGFSSVWEMMLLVGVTTCGATGRGARASVVPLLPTVARGGRHKALLPACWASGA